METRSTSSAWPRKLLTRSRFLVLQGVLLLVVLEIVGRVFDPLGISFYPETARYLSTMIREEPIGYRNRPGLDGTYYNQRVTINSLGLRNEELALAADPSVYRILLFGDSVPFGIGVRNDETLPVLLEEMLRDRVGPVDGRPVQVVNMGVTSYNTEQELIQYQSLGAQLKPDMVLLIYAFNDIEPKLWIFEKREQWWANLGQRSYAFSLLFKLRIELMRRVKRPVKMVSGGNYGVGNPRWEAVASSLAEFNALCQAAGIPFVVFSDIVKTKGWDLLVKVGEEQGFSVISINPWVDERWKDEDPADYMAEGAGSHFNRAGLSIDATLILENLQKLSLVPAVAPNP